MVEVMFSLERAKGYAKIRNNIITMYLPEVDTIPVNSNFSPFSCIEDIISELIIHELLHTTTRITEDHIIDGWHQLRCQIINKRDSCDCPIDCFWRDQYE